MMSGCFLSRVQALGKLVVQGLDGAIRIQSRSRKIPGTFLSGSPWIRLWLLEKTKGARWKKLNEDSFRAELSTGLCFLNQALSFRQQQDVAD